jgi:hypothetical protein
MKPLKLASAPAYSILFLTASILAMTGYSSASDDESAVALSQVNLTIDRARISDNRLEVRGETPGERDRVDIRILDDRGNAVLSVSRRADDNEYRLRRRPAPVPSCVAEVSANGSTVTREVDNRPAVCRQRQHGHARGR